MIACHPFLRNEHLFLPVDNEVSSWVVGTFIEIEVFGSGDGIQSTDIRSQHDRDLERVSSAMDDFDYLLYLSKG
jgi:hypothetical protein